MKLKNRDITFDIARSLCIVEIVFFLHATNYLDVTTLPDITIPILLSLTSATLVTFTFMSGYFLNRYVIKTWSDLKRFYVNRIKRFWILYFIASSILFVATSVAGQPWFDSFSNFVLSLVGLTVFCGPLPGTLWYMVILMFFYVITPIFQSMRYLTWKVCLGIVFILLFWLLYSEGILVKQAFFFFPFYLLGLLCPHDFMEYLKRKANIVLPLCTILLIIVLIVVADKMVLQSFEKLLGGIVIIMASSLLSRYSMICRAANVISYSSLAMYLFHRHFYLAAIVLYHYPAINNANDLVVPLWFLYGIICPCILIGCYLIQRVYDRMMKLLLVKKYS